MKSNYNAVQTAVLLYELGACYSACEFAEGKTLKRCWRECPHAEWLMWLIGHQADKEGWPTHKQVVLVACACVELAIDNPSKEGDPVLRKRAAKAARKVLAVAKKTDGQ